MTPSLDLPTADGVERHRMGEPRPWLRSAAPARSRVAFAAAHVVADPRRENAPGAPAAVDWSATMRIRRELWSWGLGVAEAMDTAQRGMGLDWSAVQQLVRLSAAEAAACGGLLVAGAATDHLPAGPASLDIVRAGYETQLEFLESLGVRPVLMASRQLAATAASVDDYRAVYDPLLSQVRSPVVVHWLGDMFDPALRGYWGSEDLDAALKTFVELVTDHADHIDGVKVSLLDEQREIQLRELLPGSVRVYTGDDYNYPRLILGDANGYSHALLGAFSAIAPAASAALQALDVGDDDRFLELLDSTVPLSRHLFGAPTQYYKTGIAFLAWLNGLQPGFTMVGGLHGARSVPHLVGAFRLADAAGLLADPGLAARRMSGFLAVTGAVA
jgi:hypothetical protein